MIKATSPKVTQPLLASPAVVSFDSHVVDYGPKKNYIVDATKICLIGSSQLQQGFAKKYPWICQRCYMDLSRLSHGMLKVVTKICLGCHIDLSKFAHGFVKLLCGFDEVIHWIFQSCFMYFLPFA